MKRLPQQVQDDIFRKMTADEKLAVGSGLWKLGRALAGNKITYGFDKLTTDGRNRPKRTSRQNYKSS